MRWFRKNLSDFMDIIIKLKVHDDITHLPKIIKVKKAIRTFRILSKSVPKDSSHQKLIFQFMVHEIIRKFIPYVTERPNLVRIFNFWHFDLIQILMNQDVYLWHRDLNRFRRRQADFMIRNTVQVFFQRIEDDHLWALPSGGPINDYFIRLHDYNILKSMIYNLYQSNKNFPFEIKNDHVLTFEEKRDPNPTKEKDVVTLELIFRPLSVGDEGTTLLGLCRKRIRTHMIPDVTQIRKLPLPKSLLKYLMYYPNYPGEGTKITFKTNIKDNEYIIGKVKGEIKKIKKFENLKETLSPILDNW